MTTISAWSDTDAKEAGFDVDDDGLWIWGDMRDAEPTSARWFSWREIARMHAWLGEKIRGAPDAES